METDSPQKGDSSAARSRSVIEALRLAAQTIAVPVQVVLVRSHHANVRRRSVLRPVPAATCAVDVRGDRQAGS